MKRSEKAKAGPKFRVGQVVYDKAEREYFRIDASFLNAFKDTPEEKSFRALTPRESGQRQRKGKA